MRPWMLSLFMVFTATAVQADTQQLFGPYFAASETQSSQLLLHNKRGDAEISASAYLLVSAGRRALIARRVLRPKESTMIAIDAALLRSLGVRTSEGGILIEYEFDEPQALDASMAVLRRGGGRYTMPVLRRDQIRGTVQEAVMHIPGPEARAFLAVQNTATSPRTATITVQGSRETLTMEPLTLEPLQSAIIALDSALARTGATTAAAIRLTNSGSSGDVIVTGAVTDARTRYAARLRFHDLAHGEHSRIVRAQFLVLGPQDRALGFPAGTSFRAVCTLRNPLTAPRTVRPRVKWLEGTVMREAFLEPVRLAPHEVRVIDLSAAQQQGAIPSSFHIGVLEVPYDGDEGHILAQLTSVDAATGLVLDDWMTSHESHAIAGMQWSVDEQRQTLISITNAGPKTDRFSVQLYTAAGTVDLPPVVLAGGEIALLNFRALHAQHSFGTSTGTFSVRGSYGSS